MVLPARHDLLHLPRSCHLSPDTPPSSVLCRSGGGLRVARMTWAVPDRCYHAGEVRSELPDQTWAICCLLTTMALFIDFGYGCSLYIDALTPWQTPRGADFGLSRVGPRGSGSKSPVFVGNGGRQASGLTVGGVFTSTDRCVPTLREAAPP